MESPGRPAATASLGGPEPGFRGICAPGGELGSLQRICTLVLVLALQYMVECVGAVLAAGINRCLSAYNPCEWNSRCDDKLSAGCAIATRGASWPFACQFFLGLETVYRTTEIRDEAF